MPRLIKNINASILDNYLGSVPYYTTLSSDIQFEDYINLNGFIAYLQNFTNVKEVIRLQKPSTFGLKNQYNVGLNILQISY